MNGSQHRRRISKLPEAVQRRSQQDNEGAMGETDRKFSEVVALLEKDSSCRSTVDVSRIYQWVSDNNLLGSLSNNLEQIRQSCQYLVGWSVKANEVVCEPTTSLKSFVVVLKGAVNRVKGCDIEVYEAKLKKKKQGVEIFKAKEGANITVVSTGSVLLGKETEVFDGGWLCFATEDSWLARIPLLKCLEIFKKSDPDPSLQPLLRAHTFLSEWTRREVLQLVGSIEVQDCVAGHRIYDTMEKVTHIFYLISGQVTLQPPQHSPLNSPESYPRKNYYSLHQQQHICTISQNSLFGEVEWLSGGVRSNSAVVASATTRIASISILDVENIVRNRGENVDTFKQQLHQDCVVAKENWRSKQLHDLMRFSSSQHSSAQKLTKKCYKAADVGPSPSSPLGKYLHDSREIRGVIENERTIMQMKSRYSDSTQPIISFSNRLFQRADFPELDTSLRRYQNQEKRIKKKLQLPKIR